MERSDPLIPGNSGDFFSEAARGELLRFALGLSLTLHVVVLSVDLRFSSAIVAPPASMQLRATLTKAPVIANDATSRADTESKATSEAEVAPMMHATKHAEYQGTEPEEIVAAPTPLNTALPADEEKYFWPEQLDVRPAIRTRTMPIFPEMTAATGRVSVTIELMISRRGGVLSATAIESSGFAEFDEAAVAAFRMAKFTPGYINRTPVPTRLKIVVDFDTTR